MGGDRILPRPLALLILLAVGLAGVGMWMQVRALVNEEPSARVGSVERSVLEGVTGGGGAGVGGAREEPVVSSPSVASIPGGEPYPDHSDRVRPQGPVRVVIDPGHGGADGGMVAFGLLEKELVLDLGLRVAVALRGRGISAALTRETDRWVYLEDRASFAREHPGAVFVSIHLNRYSSPRVRGVEAFVHTPAQALELEWKDDEGRRVTGRFHDERSRELGELLSRRIAERCGLRNRGVKESRLFLARQVPAPSVVLECAYLSNPMEARLVASADFRQEMAAAIAEAIEDYLVKSADDVKFGLVPWDESRSRRRSDLIRADR